MKEAVLVEIEMIHGDVFVLHEVLTHPECEEYIERAEAEEFDEAPITTAAGPVRISDVRNNDRVMIDDVEWAAELWERVRDHVPPAWAQIDMDPGTDIPPLKACGLNERLRFYRYDPGQTFKVHRDGYYEREDGERSFLTVLFFLNDDFEGGETNIIEPRSAASVRPKTGSALFFLHRLLHEGALVTRGRKYILRSDLMYR